jgi:hypothetical protein
MQNDLEQEIEEMAKRFKAPREFIEVSQSLKQVTTMRAKLEALNKEYFPALSPSLTLLSHHD